MPMVSIIVIGVVVLFLVGLCVISYKKCPPDKVFIISGLKRRTLCAQAGFVIPFLERCDKLELGLIGIDVKTDSYVPNVEFINVMIDAAVKIKIDRSAEGLEKAACNFLNRDTQYIEQQVVDLLQGNMREIVGQMTLKDMVSDRKKFGEMVQANAKPDLEALGLEILTFSIQQITDENGVIEDLGIDNVEQIRKTALKAKSDANTEVSIRTSENAKLANDANVKANEQMLIQNNLLAIKSNDLRKAEEIAKAQADSAYQIECEKQRANVGREEVEANIVRETKMIELGQKAVDVREQTLNADIRKQADADVYRREREAEAKKIERQKEAESELYQKRKMAESILITAEAEAQGIELNATAKAKEVKMMLEAEAIGILAKGQAEAKALSEKADAMAKFEGGALTSMVIDKLPAIYASLTKPLENVESITMYGEGNSAKMMEDITRTGSQVQNSLKEAIGFDMKQVFSGMLSKNTVPENSANPPVDELLEIPATK